MPHLSGGSLPEIFYCFNNYLQDHDHHAYATSRLAMLVWGCLRPACKSFSSRWSSTNSHCANWLQPGGSWWPPRPASSQQWLPTSNGSCFTPSKWNLLWVKSLKFNSRSVMHAWLGPKENIFHIRGTAGSLRCGQPRASPSSTAKIFGQGTLAATDLFKFRWRLWSLRQNGCLLMVLQASQELRITKQ